MPDTMRLSFFIPSATALLFGAFLVIEATQLRSTLRDIAGDDRVRPDTSETQIRPTRSRGLRPAPIPDLSEFPSPERQNASERRGRRADAAADPAPRRPTTDALPRNGPGS